MNNRITVHWTLKKFAGLTLDELYDLVKLRINVFVVEQNCPFPELDDKDKFAYHLIGRNEEGRVIAYTRIFGPGDYYNQPAIGRVVVDADYRKDGIGFQLMQKSIEKTEELFGSVEIKIGAQKYLKEFYKSLGFRKIGDGYIEDGIPHIYMIRNSNGAV